MFDIDDELAYKGWLNGHDVAGRLQEDEMPFQRASFQLFRFSGKGGKAY